MGDPFSATAPDCPGNFLAVSIRSVWRRLWVKSREPATPLPSQYRLELQNEANWVRGRECGTKPVHGRRSRNEPSPNRRAFSIPKWRASWDGRCLNRAGALARCAAREGCPARISPSFPPPDRRRRNCETKPLWGPRRGLRNEANLAPRQEYETKPLCGRESKHEPGLPRPEPLGTPDAAPPGASSISN
jgi:hypothetical protein